MGLPEDALLDFGGLLDSGLWLLVDAQRKLIPYWLFSEMIREIEII